RRMLAIAGASIGGAAIGLTPAVGRARVKRGASQKTQSSPLREEPINCGDQTPGCEKFLLAAIADLMRYKSLRDEFNADPEAFMNGRGMSAEAKGALYSMDRKKMIDHCQKELAQYHPPGDYPQEPDCTFPEAEYPDPKPVVARVHPNTA